MPLTEPRGGDALREMGQLLEESWLESLQPARFYPRKEITCTAPEAAHQAFGSLMRQEGMESIQSGFSPLAPPAPSPSAWRSPKSGSFHYHPGGVTGHIYIQPFYN